MPCSPSALSPQLGLEVRAPGLQPTSMVTSVATCKGWEGQELLGPRSGLGTESPLPVKLVPPLFRRWVTVLSEATGLGSRRVP